MLRLRYPHLILEGAKVEVVGVAEIDGLPCHGDSASACLGLIDRWQRKKLGLEIDNCGGMRRGCGLGCALSPDVGGANQ